MGHRRNNNSNNNLADEHIKTKLVISKLIACRDCPMRIYADEDETITLGIGFILSDTIIILPSYDFNAKIGYNTILQIVKDTYRDITKRELLEDYYVTRSVKCSNKLSFDCNHYTYRNCMFNLMYEISRINPRKLIVFDKHLYDIGIYNCFRHIIVKTIFSPAVMYYDNQKIKDMFIKQFKNAFCDT